MEMPYEYDVVGYKLLHLESGILHPLGIHNVIAVAVRGEVGDWAAYIGIALGDSVEMRELQYVSRVGTKLEYEVASKMFPMIDQRFKWRP